MNKSTTITHLATALLKFQANVDKIKKDANNPFFKSKYASLSNILDTIQAPLLASGLVISQMPTDNNGLNTIVIHAESGEFMESTYIMPVKDINNPQAVGSSLTYARRYALAGILGLNIDEDDDANKASTPPPANAELPWLNKYEKDKATITKQWTDVAGAITAHKCDIDYVLAKYKVSKELLTELKSFI
jgi:hypothetical protein